MTCSPGNQRALDEDLAGQELEDPQNDLVRQRVEVVLPVQRDGRVQVLRPLAQLKQE